MQSSVLFLPCNFTLVVLLCQSFSLLGIQHLFSNAAIAAHNLTIEHSFRMSITVTPTDQSDVAKLRKTLREMDFSAYLPAVS